MFLFALWSKAGYNLHIDRRFRWMKPQLNYAGFSLIIQKNNLPDRDQVLIKFRYNVTWQICIMMHLNIVQFL